jgi:ABC-type phosphate/phosphonate transport system substrate-binding protein
MDRRTVLSAGVTFVTLAAAPSLADDAAGDLTMIVMDPLALPLSCPCVKGYAQRKYEDLASYLQKELGLKVKLEFSESLRTALKEKTRGKADIVIGKQSVVNFDAKEAKREFENVAMLTGKDGGTTQYGIVVVKSSDNAKAIADLKGYRIFFGNEESTEKHGAAVALFKKAGVDLPKTLETVSACDEGCTKILEFPPGEKGAAVISSYAKPLLEGCGTVQKGDLRVVGETDDVPFVGAFVRADLPAELKSKLTNALLEVGNDAKLKASLETKDGFVTVEAAAKKKTLRILGANITP